HAQVWLPPGSYRFFVTVDGVRFDSGAPGHCTVPGCTSATITIADPVVVTVVDRTGQPLSDVEVLPQNSDGNWVGGQNTDADGHVSFRLAADGYRFAATLDNYFWWSGDPDHCVVPQCDSATITVYEVDVTVVDAAGAPMSNME